MLSRQELKDKSRGLQKQIAEKADVSQPAVSAFLNGKNNSRKIEMAVLETLAELSNRKKELLAQIL